MPTGEALNFSRPPSQGIALLAEEVRWSDVHQWYIDSLVRRDDVDDDDHTSQVYTKNLSSGVSCSDDNCDYSRSTEFNPTSDGIAKHLSAFRMIQKDSIFLTGKFEIASSEIRNLDGDNRRICELSTETPAIKRNAIHLLTLISEYVENTESGRN